MVTTVSHSADREIDVKNGERGTLVITLHLTFTDEIDETTAQMLLDCARGCVLEDAAQDHADVIERYARDEQDLTLEPTKYVCTTIEEFNGGIYKLTVDTFLPFAMPIEAHASCLNAVESVIGDHARAHLKDPEMSGFRKTIEEQLATPAVHLACFVYDSSPRALLKATATNCHIARRIINEIAPDEAREYPELMQFVTQNPDGPGIQITIGMNQLTRPHDESGLGQYL